MERNFLQSNSFKVFDVFIFYAASSLSDKLRYYSSSMCFFLNHYSKFKIAKFNAQLKFYLSNFILNFEPKKNSYLIFKADKFHI